MKKPLLGAVLGGLLLSAAQADVRVIYGEDNRQDVKDVTNSLHVELSRSTAAMIPKTFLRPRAGAYEIRAKSLMESMRVCSTERFAEQLAAANCSGFLVGPDLLVTAGHCIRTQADCSRYAWVFDFKAGVKDAQTMQVSAASVYSCREIIERDLNGRTRDDYALVRLDRTVTGRAPLNYRREGAVDAGDPLVVIGHPSGLPTKIADGAEVVESDKDAFFVADLDTYGGNSGSAVFNADTGVVEGILVRGAQDYVVDFGRGCRVSNVCNSADGSDRCGGEEVSRITRIKKLM